MVTVPSDPGLSYTQTVSGVDDALTALRAQLQKLPKRHRVSVWFSGGLCRPFVLPAMQAKATRDELHRIAEATAPQRTGIDRPCRLWIEDRKRGQDRVAVVVPAAVYDDLSKAVQECGHRLHEARPWWASVLTAGLKLGGVDLSMLAVSDCDSVTLLQGDNDDFSLATTFSPVVDAASARSIATRAAVAAGLSDSQMRLVTLVGDPLGPGDKPSEAQPGVEPLDAPLLWAKALA
jgi:hypothetical protein